MGPSGCWPPRGRLRPCALGWGSGRGPRGSLPLDCWAEGGGQGVATLPPAACAGWPAVAGPDSTLAAPLFRESVQGGAGSLLPSRAGLSEHLPPRRVPAGIFRGCSGHECRQRQMVPFRENPTTGFKFRGARPWPQPPTPGHCKPATRWE